MNNEYLIPANSKKSQLYFGIFKGIDLMILGIGLLIGIPFLFIDTESVEGLLLKFLPLASVLFILIPLPFYHNIRVYIRELYLFIKYKLDYPKGYFWRGWCATYGDDEDEKN